MKHRLFWSRFFLVAAIATAALIFYFSAQQGVDSQALSDSVTVQVARIIRPDFQRMTPQARESYLMTLGLIIRKNAHFCEYALLGFNLMCHLFFRSPESSDLTRRLWAWGIATAYAATDELHQLFINERSARLLDVLIDSAGSLTGTLVASLGLVLLARLLKKNLRQDL